jgi:predicted transcriptional regulator
MEDDLLRLTAQIVSALAGTNDVEADQLPVLIQSVYQTLAMVGQTVIVGLLRVAQPAVSTKVSLFSDRIVCLDCGQSFQTLRRHIAAEHGLTPEQYRVKWELPHDYPMVSANYAARQSRFAKSRFAKRGLCDGGIGE